MIFVFVVVERHANQAVFLVFKRQRSTAKLAGDFFQKSLFPAVMLFEVSPFRLDEKLVNKQFAAILAQEQYKIWLKGLTIGIVVDSKMPFIAQKIDLLVLRL